MHRANNGRSARHPVKRRLINKVARGVSARRSHAKTFVVAAWGRRAEGALISIAERSDPRSQINEAVD